MTYPPGNPGYPPAQQGNQYAPTQQYGEPAEVGPSKLPVYLTAAVAVFGLATVVSTLSFLLVLAEVINAPAGLSIGWGLYLVIATTLLQSGAAIAALLFDADVLTP